MQPEINVFGLSIKTFGLFFALNFVAEKSSHHLFQFVFELADGTVASSPTVDLLYFTPRLQALN